VDLTREREQFVGYAGDVDEITDPDCHQPDAGKRLRDAFVWIGDEFRRITTDSPTGTRMDFSRAKCRPPSPLAIQIAEHCAMRPPDERTELSGQGLPFLRLSESSQQPRSFSDDQSGVHHNLQQSASGAAR
jgi:hypothetical protein